MAGMERTSEVLQALASTVYSTAGQVITNPANYTNAFATGLPTGGIPVKGYSELDLDFNISAITGVSATATVTIDRYGADTVWYNIYNSGAKSTSGSTSTTIGLGGPTNSGFGTIIRVQITISNTTTPSVTMSLSLIGKS